MSLFCPSCCCTEVEGRAEYSLSLPARTTFKKYFQKSQNQCRFGGLKVAVGVWEEILREIGSVLAPDARERRGLAPFWHQKAKTKAGFSRVASILMPQKSFFSEALFCARSHDLPPKGDFKNYSESTHKNRLSYSLLSEGHCKFSPG